MSRESLIQALGDRERTIAILSRRRNFADPQEVKEGKEYAQKAHELMADAFDAFPEDQLTRKPEQAPSIRNDRQHYTETTPFFTDASGEQVAIQQYFYEYSNRQRKDGWLGRLGLATYQEQVKVPRHYALVTGSGNGETIEYARVESLRHGRHDFIGHNGTRPYGPVFAWSGSLDADRHVLDVLAAVRTSQLSGETALDTSL